MNNNAELYQHIDAYVLGTLPQPAKSAFETAMRRDAALAEAVELRRLEFEVAEALIANDIRAQMSRLRDGHPPNESAKNPKNLKLSVRYWLLLAALLCCAAFAVWHWRKSRQTLPDTASTTAPEPTVDTLATEKIPLPSPTDTNTHKVKPNNTDRLQALRLYEKPDLSGLRGSETQSDPLSEALNAWQKGDYAKATKLASSASPQDQHYWKAQYLSAHAAFLRQQYTAASRLFTQISASKVMPWAEESDWYLLLALLADGQKSSKAFDKQYIKIKKDSEHLYHESLKKIKYPE